jgi:hypothetical protein
LGVMEKLKGENGASTGSATGVVFGW